MKSTLRYKVKYDFNPLVNVDAIIINKDEKLVKYDDDKNIAYEVQVAKPELIDRYIKFIGDKLKLSGKARAVLKYIILEKKKSVDKVHIDMDKLKELTGYNSLGPIYAGFNQLIEHDIIARTMYGDQYFINPNFISTDMTKVGVFTMLVTDTYYDKPVEQTKQSGGVDGFDDDDLI